MNLAAKDLNSFKFLQTFRHSSGFLYTCSTNMVKLHEMVNLTGSEIAENPSMWVEEIELPLCT